MTIPSKNKQYSDERPYSLITGLGCVSLAGRGVSALWDAMTSARIMLETSDRGYCLGGIPANTCLEVLNDWRESPQLQAAGQALPDYSDKLALSYTLEAMNEAMSQAGWTELLKDDGVIFATTTGQIPVWEQPMLRFLRQELGASDFAETFKHQPLALTLNQIIAAYDFKGQAQLITSACAASTQALVLADLWIRTGRVKRCLVGGTELLCELTIRGFDSFQLLSSEPAKPFDSARNGINLSEGSAFVCLEAANRSTTKGLCVLSGGGLSADAYHMTSPEPSGRGCASAMKAALKSASLEASQIDWIYAHGTGSLHNDSAESAAVSAVFGNDVPVTSTKGLHGHALAISGVMESILAVLAIQNSVVLPTVNFTARGEGIRVAVTNESLRKPLKHVLKNTLGFGGVNGSIVLSTLPEST